MVRGTVVVVVLDVVLVVLVDVVLVVDELDDVVVGATDVVVVGSIVSITDIVESGSTTNTWLSCFSRRTSALSSSATNP
ncbi:MAG: hypothetical protein ACKOJH_06065, partial [Actinomycetota bacterium]